MSIDTLPRIDGEHEQKPILGYDEYRELCDNLQPDVCRKTGLPSPEDYEAAQNHSKTVYIEVGGRRVPLFVPLECVSGYNLESSKRLIESDNVFVLSTPIELLDHEGIGIEDYLSHVPQDAGVIIETPPSQTPNVKESIARRLPEGFVADFIDPRCPPEHQTARISIYQADMNAYDEHGEILPIDDRPLMELFDEDLEATGDTDTELIDASRMRNDEALFKQVWDLHDDKFDWLGEYHPVSMQENEDFFKKLLHEEGTFSMVRFDTNEQGERVAVCHGCVVDPSKISWLKDSFLQDLEDGVGGGGRLQFFYGIVSKSTPDKMLHYAKDVIGLDSRIMRRAGGRTRVIFESTNMSSLYIPRVLTDYTNEEPNGVKLAGDIETLSQLDYWYFKPHSSPDVKESV